MTMARASTIKYSSLALLIIQNTGLILTLRYSRSQPGPKYLTSTAVLISELLKAFLSLTAYMVTRYLTLKSDKIGDEAEEVRTLLSKSQQPAHISFTPGRWLTELVPLLIPAILYTVQNNLQLIAVSHLEAATFQVLYQGKILTTAVFMVVLLGKRLSAQQCTAIMLLTIGISCASIPPASDKLLSQNVEKTKQNHALGVAAVSAACVLSGMAGVYTEKSLKRTQRQSEHPASNLWLRNMQLSMMSSAFAISAVLVMDRRELFENGFFQGYNRVTILAILLQAVGGLVVALVVTYADNILKGFATSISVLLCAGVSVMSHSPLTPLFALGMCCVLSASCLYASKEGRDRPVRLMDMKVEEKEVLLPC